MSRILRSNAASLQQQHVNENVNASSAGLVGKANSSKNSGPPQAAAPKLRNALGDISNRHTNGPNASIDGKVVGVVLKKPSRIPVKRDIVASQASSSDSTQHDMQPSSSQHSALHQRSIGASNDDGDDGIVLMETESDSEDLTVSEEKSLISSSQEDRFAAGLSMATSALKLHVDIARPLWPFDARVSNNSQYVGGLVHDIMDDWRKSEFRKAPGARYMDIQNDITPRMREILIDWLNEVHAKFHLSLETLYLSVYILDKFLEARVVHRTKLQLVGCTAMLLAAKYEEIYAPEINEFVSISDKSFSREQMIQMESLILNALSFNITAPSAWRFLQRYQQTLWPQVDVQAVNKEGFCIQVASEFLLELTLQDYSFLSYLPSIVAASSLLLACHSHACVLELSTSGIRPQQGLLWYRQATPYIQHTDAQLRECVESIVAWTNNNLNAKYRAVRKKYGAQKYAEFGRTFTVTSPFCT